MERQKIAITIPADLLAAIDAASSRRKVSRSRFISLLLLEKMEEERARDLRQAYDTVFSDPQIQKEQIETAAFFEALGDEGGQQW